MSIEIWRNKQTDLFIWFSCLWKLILLGWITIAEKIECEPNSYSLLTLLRR